MFDFGGKNALIIGAGLNIGRAVALEFATRGARLAVADVDLAAAQETATLVGKGAVSIYCDVASDASVAAAIDAAEAALGPLDVVMNNAGIISGGNPEDIPVAEWQRMMDVNFFGMVRSIEAVLPRMIARGSGYIVNTGSFAGLYPFATSRIHYAASKAAVVSMSENLALHLMGTGVQVSCLCPGPVMTTSNLTMKQFTDDCVMRAPGSHLTLKSQGQAARALADGMEAGRIIISTDELLWPMLAERGAGIDDFIRTKHAEFERGDSGRPIVPEAIVRGEDVPA
ncbi:SDR family oxidoreductase [Sphingomonas sp. SUN039]|uniref:SDR family oxidoreductase n=1 Tax=Sphingomonas sp. SUN039 TaxID=2937787 RepID=UPI0021645764|nr:SDR family oxidoreductase [Sphingomonas sp. SUN039]UVO55753.1 SDR family oxidoreductase [Sphingomonas sp. SUN039]